MLQLGVLKDMCMVDYFQQIVLFHTLEQRFQTWWRLRTTNTYRTWPVCSHFSFTSICTYARTLWFTNTSLFSWRTVWTGFTFTFSGVGLKTSEFTKGKQHDYHGQNSHVDFHKKGSIFQLRKVPSKNAVIIDILIYR